MANWAISKVQREGWKNVFEIQTENGLDEYYNALGKEFLGFYKTLKNNPAIQVTFSVQQQIQFNEYFSKIQTIE